MKKYFGTDGIRGIANLELTPQIAYKTGQAIGYLLLQAPNPYVYVGKDSRLSSPLLEYSLISGLLSMGVNVKRLHLIPSPCVAYLTASTESDYGIMVSASHNPYYDNGIKVFNNAGKKLTDDEEDFIERFIDGEVDYEKPTHDQVGIVLNRHESMYQYIESLYFSVKTKFTGLKVGLDCANGSTSDIANRLFARLGASVTVINDKPNGKNINDQCGSTYPQALQALVKEHGLDVGFAFDGDGDRVIAVDNQGNLFDGDQIIALLAKQYHQEGRCDEVVATIMSNGALIQTLRDQGIQTHLTKVGDKYVFEAMEERGLLLGGEQAGHIILREFNTSGDGMLTALQVASALVQMKQPLSALRFDPYPQVSTQLKVKDKQRLIQDASLQALKSKLEASDPSARIVLRASGTEPLIRVMVEHASLSVCESMSKQLLDKIKSIQ
jgi:phosphoglucosamine mutase